MIDIALLLFANKLLKGDKVAPPTVVAIDPGLVRKPEPISKVTKPISKPIRKVDDTQVRPRGRFGL